ncbi:high mobility group protein Z [Ewingella americana]|uniref:High mobility group protein Z n=1 Tax=Ewingella americana TaxID=41202 RepID=A0A502G5N9_9GAMM|nr:high mobility group protein Z [Ewingella americana]
MALLFACYLLWLFVKLRRLSKTKARLYHASAARQIKHLPVRRTGRSRRRKE